MKIKNLLPLILFLFLTSCDLIEKDTILICECQSYYEEYRKVDNKKQKSCQPLNVRPTTLKYNEFADEFMFGNVDLIKGTSKEGLLIFKDDRITQSNRMHTVTGRSYRKSELDRETLVYTESFIRQNGVTNDGYANWGPELKIFYQCRVAYGLN
jgi:hypothetical protein